MASTPNGETDRLLELANIGAGHAATALASLTGETCLMSVPAASVVDQLPPGSLLGASARVALGEPLAGVFFEVRGALRGSVAVLLPRPSRERILERLLGPPRAALEAGSVASALQELGNILASHVVSAMAETIGEPILLSTPAFSPDDAIAVLASLIALRHPERPDLRIETVIADRSGETQAILVFLPAELRAG
jgi:chemotaxis protein CheC